MDAKILRESLLNGGQTILNDRYRVRLFPTVEVPILCNFQSLFGSEVIVIDLPQAEGVEQRFLGVEKDGTAAKSNSRHHDSNKENVLPEGCTLGGDPLQVSFLTIEKLEKTSKRAPTSFTNAQLIHRTPFNTHLMTSLEALDFVNDLCDPFDVSLANVTQVVLADASSCQNLLFFAQQRQNKQITQFKATYLGNMKDAMRELNSMTAQLQVLQLRRCVCRCRFDVLRDIFYRRRHSEFREASFSIQAEWLVQLPKTKIQRKVIPFENFLAMPPDNAKVVVKFKPGWMDDRVELTNNICELKHLSDLALSLKAGKIPWKKTIGADGQPDSEAEERASALVLQGVTELIERARDRPDIESVYPFDFTDRLWEIICRVNSTETLKSTFEMIYAELRTGEFRVMVEQDKESSLAKMLRVRTLDNMVFPRLEPLTCLQMLVEIGVDRFKGDIQHRFIKSEFVTNVTELEPFFLHASAPVEERIEQLMPLYLALQSMLMIEKFVRLTPHKKMLMAKRLLGHFTALKNVDANSKEFSFDAYMEDIYRDSLKPCMTEWSTERIYEKPARTMHGTSATPSKGGGGLVHEIAFLSKFIGFAHIAPISLCGAANVSFQSAPSRPVLGAQDSNVLAPSKLMNVIKSEINSATNTPLSSSHNDSEVGVIKSAGDITEENEEDDSVDTDEQCLFDCVYIVGTSNSMSAFGDGAAGAGLASKSPSPIAMTAADTTKS